ncbi:unnamed protein product [Amoebophrya sp. A25]|nr:unnamed protein product [Amoebophrya sp. A25]|eukprot:GSA25T00003764001.1
MSKFPLHDAVRSGRVETLREKISEISSSSDIDCADNNGNSPLLLAVMSGAVSAVQCLVEHGASPDFAVQRRDATITPKTVAIQREKERMNNLTQTQTQFAAEVSEALWRDDRVSEERMQLDISTLETKDIDDAAKSADATLKQAMWQDACYRKGTFDNAPPWTEFRGLPVMKFELSKVQFERRQVRRMVVDGCQSLETQEEASLEVLKSLIPKQIEAYRQRLTAAEERMRAMIREQALRDEAPSRGSAMKGSGSPKGTGKRGRGPYLR